MNPDPGSEVSWFGSLVLSGSSDDDVIEAASVWEELGEAVMVSASEAVEESEVIAPEDKDAGEVSERLSADDVTPLELKIAVSDGTMEELSALEVSVAEVLIWVSDATNELDEGTSFVDDKVGATTIEELDDFTEVGSTSWLDVVVGFGATEIDVSFGAWLVVEGFSGVAVVFSTTGVVLAVVFSTTGVVLTGVVFLGVVFFFRGSTLARSSISTVRRM